MGHQATFRSSLTDLLNFRLDTIPWHHTNMGIEIQREHCWRLEEMFTLCLSDQRRSYLVAYDTMGFVTYLLLQYVTNVTHHATVDRYEFALAPKEKWIENIIDMPPKHPVFDRKFDTIVVPSFFMDTVRDRRRMLLPYLRRMLNKGGQIIYSYIFEAGIEDEWNKPGDLIDMGFHVDCSHTEPMDLRTTPKGHFIVERLEVRS